MPSSEASNRDKKPGEIPRLETLKTDMTAEYVAWLEALPDTLQDTAIAEALRTVSELDLTELQAIDPPRGFGRD